MLVLGASEERVGVRGQWMDSFTVRLCVFRSRYPVSRQHQQQQAMKSLYVRAGIAGPETPPAGYKKYREEYFVYPHPSTTCSRSESSLSRAVSLSLSSQRSCNFYFYRPSSVPVMPRTDVLMEQKIFFWFGEISVVSPLSKRAGTIIASRSCTR